MAVAPREAPTLVRRHALPGGWTSAGVLLAYLCVTLAVTAPLGWHLGDAYIGGYFAPSHFLLMETAWSHLLRGELPPLQSHVLNFPEGGALVLIGWPLLALGLPLRAVLSPVAAGNLAFLLLFTLAALTMFWLAWRLTGCLAGAFLAGLIFAFSPYALVTVTNGHVYSMFLAWLPAYLLAMDVALWNGGWRAWMLCGLLLVMNCFENPYYGVMALLFLLLAATAFAVTSAVPAATRARRLALLAAVAALAVVPVRGYYSQVVDLRGQQLLRPTVRDSDIDLRSAPLPWPQVWERANESGQLYAKAVDPVVLFKPRQAYARGVLEDNSWARHTVYAGWTVCLLALAGGVLAGWRSAGLWLVSLGFFLALSLGDTLILNGHTVLLSAATVPMPKALLGRLSDTLNQMTAAYRFMAGGMLCLAVLAAFGWKAVTGRLAPGWVLLLTVSESVLILSEFLFVAPVVHPMPMADARPSPAYRWLAAQPDAEGLVEYPYEFDGGDGGEPYVLYAGLNQTYYFPAALHGKPLGILDRFVPGLRLDRHAEIRALHRQLWPGFRPLAPSLEGTLRQAGFGWVLVHARRLPPQRREAALDCLERLFGPPAFSDPEADELIFRTR